MTIDKGGLDYPIEVKYSSVNLRSFKSDLDRATSSYSKLRSEVERPIRSGGITDQAEKAARSASRAARAESQLTRQQENRERALRNLYRQQRRLETSQQEAIASARSSFALQRQLSTEAQARVTAERKITDALDKRAAKEKLLSAVQSRGLQNNKQLRKDLGLLSRDEKTLESVQKDRARTIENLRKAEKTSSDSELAALRGRLQAQQLIARAEAKRIRDQTLTDAGRRDLIPGKPKDQEKQLSFLQRLNRALLSTDNRANRVSFTFRRLFGILAAFTLAREIASAFVRLSTSIFTVNDQLERTEIGIAAVLAATADVRNSLGDQARGAERLSIAQAEARKQSRLLRVEALSTAATFEELFNTFQVGLAPGLQANLTVDQIRALTVQISQAATALDVAQNQLSEEIRSLFAGTITPRNTRIATALGITNEDIRNAKQAGTLYQFLSEQFEAFSVAGDQASNTLRSLRTRIADALGLLLATGGEGSFTDLKDLFKDILSNLVQIDRSTGSLALNPKILSSIRILSSAFSTIIDDIRDIGEELGEKGIADAVSVISTNLIGASKVVSGIVQGFFDFFRFASGISNLLSSIFSTLEDVFNISIDLGKSVADTVRGISLVFTTLVAIQLILGVITPVVRGIYILAQNIAVVTNFIVGRTVLAAVPVFLILAGVLSILSATGALGSIVEAISSKVSDLSGSLLKNIGKQVDGISSTLGSSIQGTVQASLQGISDIRKHIADLRGDLDDARAETSVALFSLLVSPEDSNFENRIGSLTSRFVKFSRDTRNAIETTEKSVQDLDKALANLDRRRIGRTELIDSLVDGLGGIPDGLSKESFFDSIEEYILSVRSLTDSTFELGKEINTIDNLLSNKAFIAGSNESDITELRERRARIAVLLERSQERLNSLVSQDYLTKRRLFDLLSKENEFSELSVRLAKQKEEAEQALLELRQQNVDIILEQARVELIRENAASKIEQESRSAVQTLNQQAAVAEFLGDVERARLLNIQSESAARRVLFQQQERALQADIDRLEFLREEAQIRISELDALRQKNLLAGESAGLSEEEERSSQAAYDALQEINKQLDFQLQKQKDINQERSNALALLDQQEREQAIRLSGSLSEQLALAISDLSRDLPSRFESIFSILKSAVSDFGSFTSSVIVDAFDPGKRVDLRERFARFLQGIAQQIIATLTQLAEVSALANSFSGGILGPLFRVTASGAGGIGFAEGGKVDHNAARRARPHPRHFSRPRGRHAGGMADARPSGLHPTDTVPLWLAKNEFVLKAASAAQAGYDALERINSGRFSRTALRAAVGLGGTPERRSAARYKGAGMADGGRVASAPGQVQGGQAAPAVALAVLSSSEDTVRELLGGNNNVFREMMNRNSDLFR